MFPIELHDYREGMQVMAYCYESLNGTSKFELPGSVEAISQGGFLAGQFYPLAINRIEGKTIELVMSKEELFKGCITTGVIQSHEDLGYLISFSNGQRGFLPYSQRPTQSKQLKYIAVKVVSIQDRNVTLEPFNFAEGEMTGILSPGALIRGKITNFTDVQAEVQCNNLPNFTAKLAFEHFRRVRDDESQGFYKGFEDDFIILTIDYELNQILLSCKFDYRLRDLSQVLYEGRFLLNQKVFLHTNRTYFELDLEEQGKSCDVTGVESDFENTWLYVNDPQFKDCYKLQFPPVPGQVIPMLEVLNYEIFEDVFRCFAVNTDEVLDSKALHKEQEKESEQLPFKIGDKLAKFYEVIVNEIGEDRIIGLTSYMLHGVKQLVRVSTRVALYSNVHMKENLAAQHKLTVVGMQFQQSGKLDYIDVSPLAFPEDTLHADIARSGDFGSGIVVKCMDHEPYSIVQIIGDEGMCFERLEFKKTYAFQIVFQTPGLEPLLYETDKQLTDLELLGLYKRQEFSLLVERFNLTQRLTNGTVFQASEILLEDISPGCFICRARNQYLLLPHEILKENEIDKLLEGKTYRNGLQLSSLLSHKSYTVIKQFGDPKQSRTIIVPTKETVSSIAIKEVYQGLVTRVAQDFYIATLMNGAEVHIRSQDATERCYLMQFATILVLRQLESDFYIGRVISEQVDLTDSFVPSLKPEFKSIAVAVTDNINNVTSIGDFAEKTRVFGDLLLFQSNLPYPQLVVDLGAGILGRLDMRGLLTSNSFARADIEPLLKAKDYEATFKALVGEHARCEVDGNIKYQFYVNKTIDFIGEQMQHLGLTAPLSAGSEDSKGISVVDLNLFSEEYESNLSVVIFAKSGITICQMLERKHPSVVVLTDADLVVRNAEQRASAEVGDLIDFAQNSLLPLGDNAVSKLIHNAVQPQLLLWDYQYFAPKLMGISVQDQIVPRPFIHRQAILSACILIENSSFSMRISPAGYDPSQKDALQFLSPYDVAWCQNFVPTAAYQLHEGMVLRAVVQQLMPDACKLSLGVAGSARMLINPETELKPLEVIDVVVEQVTDHEVLVNERMESLIPQHEVGVTARFFYGVMVRKNESGVVCQLDNVYPPTFCELLHAEFAHGRATQLNIVRNGTALVATAGKAEKLDFTVKFGAVTLPRESYPAYFALYEDPKQLERELTRSRGEFNLVLQKSGFCDLHSQLDMLEVFPHQKLRGQDLINYFQAKMQLLIQTQGLDDDFFMQARNALKEEFQTMLAQYVAVNHDFKAVAAEIDDSPCAQAGKMLNRIIFEEYDPTVDQLKPFSFMTPLVVHALVARDRVSRAIEFIRAVVEDVQLMELKPCISLVMQHCSDEEEVLEFFQFLLTVNYGREQRKFKLAIQDDYEQYLKHQK